jgi:hypothetical protein
MRLPEDTWGFCSSLTVLYGDSNVDLRSGGLIGYPMIEQRFGRKHQQTECILRGPHGEGVVRWFGDIPATHCNTADEIIRLHDLDVSETRRQARLGGRPGSDQAPGSTSLGNTKAVIEAVVAEPQEDVGQVWRL